MADLSLTKVSGRLKVNIGAVLRTRVNTGDNRCVEILQRCKEEGSETSPAAGFGDGLRPMMNPH